MANMGDREKGQKLGSVLEPMIKPFAPRKGHDPRELRSWAKKTGFVSTFSGETERSMSGRRDLNERFNNDVFVDRVDLEKGGLEKHESISPKIEIDPILGRTRDRGVEIEPVRVGGNGRDNNGVFGLRDGTVRGENERRKNGVMEPISGSNIEVQRDGLNGNGNAAANRNGNMNGRGAEVNVPVVEEKKDDGNFDREGGINVYPDGENSGDGGGLNQSPKIICGPRDNPGVG